MTYGPVAVHYVRPVGWVASGYCSWGTCTQGHHYQHVEYMRGTGPAPGGVPAGWGDVVPTACSQCGAPYVADAPEQQRGGGCHTVWDTPSGKLEPGCLWWADWLPHKPLWVPAADGHHLVQLGRTCWSGWTNCSGRHLYAMCPNGAHWDIDSRASNCTLPAETTHRCWVRRGDPEADPPELHIDKDGPTCAAGAGSIVASDYHGFLHHGAFTAG